MQVSGLTGSSDSSCHTQCGLPIVITKEHGIDTGIMVWESDIDKRCCSTCLSSAKKYTAQGSCSICTMALFNVPFVVVADELLPFTILCT